MDLVMTIISILFIDFFRGLWARYCNRWWCWNLETVFPEYGEFKVAENVLHLINNQGMIWLGVFFSPLLPAINNVKMIILLHIRAWAVLTCNVPATEIFRASRSSNFYLILLLLMLFLCTLPVVFVLVSRRPSKICGPFGYQSHYFGVLVEGIPDNVKNYLDYMASPGIIIPAIVLLFLIIYFLWSLNRGLKEANQDLQKQLIHERTEEKRKIYEMAGKKNATSGLGGGRKTPMPEKRKVDYSHLTEHEKLQRDPWYRWKLRNVAPKKICVEEEEEPFDDDDDSLSGETAVLLNKGAFGRPRQNGGWRTAESTQKSKSSNDHPTLKSKKQALITKLSENQAYVPSLRSLPEETDHQTDRELKTSSSERCKKAKSKYISSSTSTSSSNTDTDDISTTLENISEIHQPCTSRSAVSFEDSHQSPSMPSQSTWPCSLASAGLGQKKLKKHLLKVPRGRGVGASSSSIDDDEDGRRYTSSPANMQKRSTERPKSVTSDYHTPPSTPTIRKSASAVGGDVAAGGIAGRPARSASETLTIQIERDASPSGGSSSSSQDGVDRGDSSDRHRKSIGRVFDKLRRFLTPMKKLSRSRGRRAEKLSRERVEDYCPLSPSDEAWDRAQETFI
uniref:TMC domain-containing protein n=1 Tax=Romanomermis culicivorax TaxID=13658 RepID=A0A915IRE4_ROMCU